MPVYPNHEGVLFYKRPRTRTSPRRIAGPGGQPRLEQSLSKSVGGEGRGGQKAGGFFVVQLPDWEPLLSTSRALGGCRGKESHTTCPYSGFNEVTGSIHAPHWHNFSLRQVRPCPSKPSTASPHHPQMCRRPYVEMLPTRMREPKQPA